MPRLSVRHLLVLVPILGAAVGAVRPITDNSFLWHVRAGTLQLDQGEVLRADPFSWSTGGAPWRTQSWLAELGYGWAERITGNLSWVGPMMAVVAIALFGLLGLIAFRETRRLLPTAGLLSGALLLALPFLNPRPALFSYLGLALLVVVLAAPARLAWTAPLLIWVWAGLHGSFVVGLGLLALNAIRQRRRPAWELLAASVIAASLTAHGIGIWSVLGEFAGSRQALGFIREWATPNLLAPVHLPFLALLAGVLLAAQAGRLGKAEVVGAFGFFAFGAASVRNLVPAAILLAPLAARAVPPLRRAVRPSPIKLGWAIGLLMVGTTGMLVSQRMPLLPSSATFPVEASQHLNGDRVFHDDAAGGYLIYAYGPDRQVFIDDRAELYGGVFYSDFVDMRGAVPAAGEKFASFGFQQALVRPSMAITGQLRCAGWTTSYQDGDLLVLEAPGAQGNGSSDLCTL